MMPAGLLDGETEESRHSARRGRGQVVLRHRAAGLKRGQHRHLLDVHEEGSVVHGAQFPHPVGAVIPLGLSAPQ